MNLLPAITKKARLNMIAVTAILSAVLLFAGFSLLLNMSVSDKAAAKTSQKFSKYINNRNYEQALKLFNGSGKKNHGKLIKSRTSAKLDELLASNLKEVSEKVLEGKNNAAVQESLNGLALFKKEISDVLYSEFNRVGTLYSNKAISYDKAADYFERMKAFSFARSEIGKHEAVIMRIYGSRVSLANGSRLMGAGDYTAAIGEFERVAEDDPADYQISRDGIRNCSSAIYSLYMKKAQDFFEMYNYKAAYGILTEALEYFPGDSGIKQKISYYKAEEARAESQLVPYDGIVEHIFFHPLIAYPEKAFDGDYMSNGYNYWFVTVEEFKRIIQALYENNYILIDINSLYECTAENDREVFNKGRLMLPENKKPVIISVDDINYYEYMIANGNVHKLVLDNNGNVATYSVNAKGEEVISRDNEIVPILDRFVEQHPDFSFRGAKGTLALTGYQGVLGYRTQDLAGPGFNKEKEGALKVIKRLRQTGWNFASHSYGHPAMGEVSFERLVKDTDDWKNEVESLVGKTKIYIYPYGSRVPYDSPKFKYLYDAGFRVFCGVGAKPYKKYTSEYLAMDRRNVDGYSLARRRDTYLPLYDSDKIIDSSIRPALKP